MKNFSVLLLLMMSFFSSAHAEDQTPKPTQKTSLTEIGLTLGTPAGLNLVLGYWDVGASVPWLVRVSGMSYGSNLEGIQGDLGWVFFEHEHFKQYLAATFTAGRNHNDVTTHHMTLGGPTYGFNLYGFAVQAGLGFGTYDNVHDDGTLGDTYNVQLLAQVGYTFLF